MGRTTNTLLTAVAASAAICTTIDAFSPSLPSSSSSSVTRNAGVLAGGVFVGREREVDVKNNNVNPLQMSSLPPDIQNQPTELPDSLGDAASIAANVSFVICRTLFCAELPFWWCMLYLGVCVCELCVCLCVG